MKCTWFIPMSSFFINNTATFTIEQYTFSSSFRMKEMCSSISLKPYQSQNKTLLTVFITSMRQYYWTHINLYKQQITDEMAIYFRNSVLI